jgi:hypothetical protein
MTTLNDLEMPVGLKILVRNPPLLNGESKEDYYALLAEMIDGMDPSDPPEFIWVINFTNWNWEVARNANARTVLINEKIWPALSELRKTYPRQLGDLDGRWLIQNFRTELPKHGINPDIVNSSAVVLASSQLKYIDNTIDALQRRCDTILQLLEGRRDVFAARARQNAADIRERKLHLARMEALSRKPDAPATPQLTAKQTANTPALLGPASK